VSSLKNQAYLSKPNVKGDSWEEVMKAVDKYDKELCEGWNKDVDSTLVFVSDILRSARPITLFRRVCSLPQ
jgi:hypothetical protein